MIVYISTRVKRLVRLEFVRFCIVGGTGFVINFTLLVLLKTALGLPTFLAQVIGAEVSLFSNFLLHDRWTYNRHVVRKSKKTLLIQFHATSWPAILGSAAMVTAAERIFHLNNLLALSVSSAVALFWNYFWSKFIIWRNTTAEEIEEIVA